MKNLKKALFSFLLLFVGILTVHAEGEIPATDLNVWKSVVTDMTANIAASNNCIVSTGTDLLDPFKVGNDCVATAIKTGEEYALVGRADSGSGDGATYWGKITASTNNMTDVNVLLSEIVELVYNDNSSTTKRLKKFALDQTDKAGGATKVVLKAGSSSNALYIYGGYEGKTMSGIKITYNPSNKRFSYQIVDTEAGADQFLFATYITKYLIEYVMEASPNYTEAFVIYNDSDKYNKVKTDFENTYGKVLYQKSGTSNIIKIDVLGSGDINNKLISLYNQANTQTTPNNNTNNNQNTDGQDNPNTGAFANVFAMLAFIGVGTVILLGNKRKLFKI